MIESNKNKNQNPPFSRFYFPVTASHESKVRAFSENEFNQILKTFFELYGFDPRYLVSLIQSVLDLTSGAAYTTEGVVKMNLPVFASPPLQWSDKKMLLSPWPSRKKSTLRRKFVESLHTQENIINNWSYARSLFHEVLHSVFEKGTIGLLINALHLDNAIFCKAKKSHLGVLFVFKTILDRVDNDKELWRRVAVEEFGKRKKAYGEKYAVLVLYKSYLVSLEELVIRFMDKLITDHFKIEKAGQEDYWSLKEHEAFLLPHPERINEYGSTLNYMSLPQNIIADLTEKCNKKNLFNGDSKQLIFLVKEIIDEYFTFSSFNDCLQKVALSKQILDAVTQLNDEVEVFSHESVQELSKEINEFLEPYHQSVTRSGIGVTVNMA